MEPPPSAEASAFMVQGVLLSSLGRGPSLSPSLFFFSQPLPGPGFEETLLLWFIRQLANCC